MASEIDTPLSMAALERAHKRAIKAWDSLRAAEALFAERWRQASVEERSAVTGFDCSNATARDVFGNLGA